MCGCTTFLEAFWMASGRYQALRSVSDVHLVFVLFDDGSFYELVPDDVRKQGPGRGSSAEGTSASSGPSTAWRSRATATLS